MATHDFRYIFILCSERSGSNLLNYSLGIHADICAPSPVDLIRYLWQNRKQYGDLSLDVNWNLLLKHSLGLFETKLGEWASEFSFDQLRSQIQERSMSAVIKYIYTQEAQMVQKQMISIKEVHVYNFLDLLESNFNNPQFIYMVRDPRDMALSWKSSAGIRGCVIRAAQKWQNDQQHYLRLLEKKRNKGNIIFMTYESFIQEKDEKLAQIASFLGLSDNFSSSSMTSKNIYARLFPKEWENLNRPVIKDNFNKYKKGLSKDEIKYIEAVCHHEMQTLRYTLDFPLEEPVDVLESRILHLELNEKPAYQEVDEKIKQKLAARRAILKEISESTNPPFS